MQLLMDANAFPSILGTRWQIYASAIGQKDFLQVGPHV